MQDLDSTRGTATQRLNSPSHVTHHQTEDDTLEALQTKVGIDGSAVTTTLDYLVKNTNSNNVTYSGNLTLSGTNTVSGNTTFDSATLRSTRPRITTSLDDSGGNELLVLTATASAVNELTLANAATGSNPTLTGSGGDTNVGLNITPKGSGKLRLTANDFELVGAAANIQVNNADPKRAFYIPASAFTTATTNGAASGTIETTTNKVIIPVFDFDTTTQEFVAVAIPSPHFWDASTVTVQFIWTAASGSGAVVWAAQGVAFSDDDAMDTAYGTEQTIADTLITAVDDHHTSFTSAITIAGTPVAGDLICLRFKRVPADAGDTLAADARLIGVKVRFGIAQYDDQ